MKSEYEKSAADAAVSAVEARWRRQHLQDLRKARQKAFNNWFFGLLFIAIVAGAGWVGWQWFNGRSLRESIQVEELTTQVGNLFSESPEAKRAMEFSGYLRTILNQPLKRLKDMPKKLWADQAPSGTTYLALRCGRDGVPALFRLVSDGHGALAASELSPLAPERKLKWSNFKSRCASPYLLSVEGAVYLNGSKNLKDGEAILRRVREAISQSSTQSH